MNVGRMYNKLQRKIMWGKFEENKSLISIKLKEKVNSYITNASQRNEMLMALFRSAANNIRNEISKKEEEIHKGKLFQRNMIKMISSMEENSAAVVIYSSQEETFFEWWHNKFEKETEMTKQLEEDNLFYISKKSWNEIRKENICLKLGENF
jgi:hypothetical protein